MNPDDKIYMFQRSFSNRNFNRNRFSRGRSNGGNFRRSQPKPSTNPMQYVNKGAAPQTSVGYVVQHQFADFALDQRIKANVVTRGYTTPTPIQDQIIGHILNGKDVVGIANTGTGKTAAFLLPIINKILLDRNQKVLVLAPTRELAVQIHQELIEFAKGLSISASIVIGGASINRQIFGVKLNPNIVIGTPGRLKDLINRHILKLAQFQTVVLDEVDRMLDIGFINDIKFIISHLSRDRQSLFFSATVSAEINGIIQVFLKNPITVSVKSKETAQGIEQDVIRISNKEEKIEKLNELLRQDEFRKVLIFGRTKWNVERLAQTLEKRGFSVASIHGNKSQGQRQRALTQFKENQLQVLVATDIAARGLDIDDVSHVINFDEPLSYTDYVHRIGRTGRANKTGKALTFVG